MNTLPAASSVLSTIAVFRPMKRLCFSLLVASAALTAVTSAATLTWDPAGDASGSGGAGAWDTVGSSWYDGTVDNPWVNANGDTAVFGGTGGNVVLSEAINANGLTFNTTGYTISGAALTLTGTTPGITVTNSSDTATVSAVISGSAGLVKSGAGNLVISTVSNYTGGTTLSGGTLTLGAANTIATANALAVSSASTLAVSTSQTIAGAISLTAALTVTGSNFTSSGVISGAGALVLNATGGSFTIGGTASSTYTGGTTLLAGTFLQGNATIANQFGTGTVYLGDTVADTANVLLRVRTVSNAIVLNSGTTGTITIDTVGASTGTVSGGITGTNNLRVMATNSGALTLSGSINNVGTLTSTSGSTTTAGSVKITGAIGSNVTTLTVNNPFVTSVLSLSGTSNAYTGNTVVTSGILQLAASNVLPDGTGKGSLSIASAGKFDLYQFSETINGLSGMGVVDKSNATNTSTLTVGNANATSTFDGTIKNTAGTLALTKVGTGTLTLTGTNTYSGTTTIALGGGILAITNASALGAGTTVANSNTGATTGTLQLQLTGTNTIAKNFTFNSANSLSDSAGGGFAQIQNVSGDNTITGTLLLSGTGGNGINVQSDAGSLTLSGNISSSVADSNRSLAFGGAGNGFITGAITDGGVNKLSVKKIGAGTWSFSGANTFSNGLSVTNGTLIAANASALGLAGVSVSGAGAITTSVANVNTGAFTIAGGTVTLGSGGGNTVTLASASNLVMSSGTLNLTLTSASLFDHVIGAGGTFSLTGGTLKLNNVSDYASSYTLITGFASGTVSGLTISGYDTANWAANLDSTGTLTFTAVPEPSVFGLLGTGVLAAASVVRRRKKATGVS